MFWRDSPSLIWRQQDHPWHVLLIRLIRGIYSENKHSFSQRKCWWMADLGWVKDERWCQNINKKYYWGLWAEWKKRLLDSALCNEYFGSLDDKLDSQPWNEHNWRSNAIMCWKNSKAAQIDSWSHKKPLTFSDSNHDSWSPNRPFCSQPRCDQASWIHKHSLNKLICIWVSTSILLPLQRKSSIITHIGQNSECHPFLQLLVSRKYLSTCHHSSHRQMLSHSLFSCFS